MIKGEIVKGKDLPAQLRKSSEAMRSGVERTVQMLALKLVASVVRKLNGQVLNVRTGRLWRSINAKPQNTENVIASTVGTNVKYAAVHELGGTFKIPDHLRMQKMAWGKPMKMPRKVNVRAHSATYPRRSFLVASLNQMEPEIREKLAQAIIQGIELR